MLSLLKLLHVLFVVVFLGNIFTGLFWHAWAMRTRDARILAHTMAGIRMSDRLFTNPGALGITLAGIVLATRSGYPLLGTPWIAATLALFSLSGLVFALRLAPLQKQMHRYAEAAAESGAFDWERYRAMAHAWDRWGALALVTPLLGMALMVLKPGR